MRISEDVEPKRMTRKKYFMGILSKGGHFRKGSFLVASLVPYFFKHQQQQLNVRAHQCFMSKF